MKLPKTVVAKLYIQANDYNEVTARSVDMSEYGNTTLGIVEVTVDVPQITDEEITTKKVDYLRKGREEVVEEFSTKLANIDEQINELLALPNLKVV